MASSTLRTNSSKVSRAANLINYAELPPAPNDHFWWTECGYWSIITPVAQDVTNLIQNPSFEFGVDGWDPLGPITLTSTAAAAVFGRRGMRVQNLIADNSTTVRYNAAPEFAPITITPGQTAFFTVWVRAPFGMEILVDFEHQAAAIGQTLKLSLTNGRATATGDWQQLTGSITFAGAVNPALAALQVFPGVGVSRERSGPIFGFDVDGAMVTTGAAMNTFFDGSTNGATWNGAAHASTSTASRFSRALGTLNNFTDMGLDIIGDSGWGMPPVEGVTSSFASVVGSHFQRQRYLPRTLTLVGVIQGCSLSDVSAKRRVIQRRMLYPFEPFCNEGLTLSYQLVSPCCGALARRLEMRECHYAGGLEGERRSLYSERVILQFAASSKPFWVDPLEHAADLNTNNTGTSIVAQGTAQIFPIFELVNTTGAVINQNIQGDINNDTTGQRLRFLSTADIVLQPGESLLINTDPIAFKVSTTLSGIDYTNQLFFQESSLGLPMLVPGFNSLRADFTNAINPGLVLTMRYNDTYLSADDTALIRRCSNCGSEFP